MFGIAAGLQRGGVAGTTQAGINAGALYNRNAATFGGTSNPTLGAGLGIAGGALGIYNGIKQGGVAGYGGAAVGGLQAASGAESLLGNAGAAGALGSAAGYVAAPLAVYNAVNNWQSGKTGSDTLNGAEAGAAIGTGILPGIGTVVGGVIGGAVGALSSAFGPGAKDPEQANFGNYATAYKQGGPSAVAQATPPQAFKSLAGLFDLRSGQISPNVPMYNKYGRMGENQFMSDTAKQINSAISSGQLQKGASPDQIYQQVVAPWMKSWGKGNLSQDPNGAAIQNIVTQLIGQWQNGQLTASTPVGISGEKISNLPSYGG